QRDEGHLQRDDQQADHDDEQDVPERELHPREGVGGEGRNGDRDDRPRDGDDQAVDERIAHSLSGEHVAVALQGEVVRRGQGVPPSVEAHRGFGAERVDERPDRRDEPHDEDDGDDEVEGPPADPEASFRAHDIGGHRTSSCRRIWRMLDAMTGTIAASSTTATALARPYWLKENWLHISRAITLVS